MSAKLKIEKGEMKFRKIFSETTEPISREPSNDYFIKI
jgi:hypothetical protein